MGVVAGRPPQAALLSSDYVHSPVQGIARLRGGAGGRAPTAAVPSYIQQRPSTLAPPGSHRGENTDKVSLSRLVKIEAYEYSVQ